MGVSSRTEDYLEEIFSFRLEGRPATVTALAERLGVAKATVVAAVRRLVNLDLVAHEPYGALHLTEEGKREGLRIHRRHALLAGLFSDMLGMTPENASEVACAMEHSLNDDTERRLFALADFLYRARRAGWPWAFELQHALSHPCRLPRPLPVLPLGEPGVVTRVATGDEDRERLHHLGLYPGADVVLIEERDGNLRLRIHPQAPPGPGRAPGEEMILSREDGARVWVCIPDPGDPSAPCAQCPLKRPESRERPRGRSPGELPGEGRDHKS
ncbi:MAG TPA: metal-dependent transcriptional regulator [Synergistaceae bacterium]|nr:MAG: Transcriptional regulator MntR [Synergistetes bacterium ADurb.Bin520]HOU33655.1 metal-dependent transcriptional regulator [Synergistaceae bacterium]HQK25792.1 metal-dependent transcriptional regulator [Synergistaceae bacterium]